MPLDAVERFLVGRAAVLETTVRVQISPYGTDRVLTEWHSWHYCGVWLFSRRRRRYLLRVPHGRESAGWFRIVVYISEFEFHVESLRAA